MEVVSEIKSPNLKTELKTDSDHNCPICKDPYDIDSKTTLLCNHSYHYDCILVAYKYAANTNGQDIRSCPLCRQYGGFLPKKHGDKYIHSVHMPEKGNHANIDSSFMQSSSPPILTSWSLSPITLSSTPWPWINQPIPSTPNVTPLNIPSNSPVVVTPPIWTNINNNNIKKKSNIQCKGIIKAKGSYNFGKQCKYFAINTTDYCGKHQASSNKP